jgi:hypothetical protein
VTITIEKKSGTPAEIVVRQGDDEWKATGDEYRKLPAKVRNYVEGLFGEIEGVGVRVVVPDEFRLRLRGRGDGSSGNIWWFQDESEDAERDEPGERSRRIDALRNRIGTTREAYERQVKKLEQKMRAQLEQQMLEMKDEIRAKQQRLEEQLRDLLDEFRGDQNRDEPEVGHDHEGEADHSEADDHETEGDAHLRLAGSTRILPSPIRPVRATSTIFRTTCEARASSTQSVISTFGRNANEYSVFA